MSKLRGAVVGCGMIAEFHLRGWARIPEVEIVALADPDRSRAEDRRARFAPAAGVYAGLEEILRAESLDFVDIVTPPWLHARQCLVAARAGLHIVCQKPLCDDWAEACALVEALKDYPRKFTVHENHRYRPWFREMLAGLGAGGLGRPLFLRLAQHDPCEPPEKIDTEVERGVLLQYGVHLLDMAHAVFGVATRVQARIHRINPRVRGESLAHVVLEYPEATAVVEVSWKASGMQQGEAMLLGATGEAHYEGKMTRDERARFRVSTAQGLRQDEQRSPAADYVDSFYALEREFADAMIHGRPAPQPARQNLESLKMAFAAYEAARTGQPVVMAEFAAGAA